MQKIQHHIVPPTLPSNYPHIVHELGIGKVLTYILPTLGLGLLVPALLMIPVLIALMFCRLIVRQESIPVRTAFGEPQLRRDNVASWL